LMKYDFEKLHTDYGIFEFSVINHLDIF